MGQSNAEGTVWIAHSQLHGKSQWGVAVGGNVVCTVDTHQGRTLRATTLSWAWTFNGIGIVDVAQGHPQTSGSAVVTVVAASLSGTTTPAVSVGGTPGEASIWVSTTTLLARVSSGAMSRFSCNIAATVGGLELTLQVGSPFARTHGDVERADSCFFSRRTLCPTRFFRASAMTKEEQTCCQPEHTG